MPVVEPESRSVDKNSPVVGMTTLEKLLTTFNIRLGSYLKKHLIQLKVVFKYHFTNNVLAVRRNGKVKDARKLSTRYRNRNRPILIFHFTTFEGSQREMFLHHLD